jgi:hypothetical protein
MMHNEECTCLWDMMLVTLVRMTCLPMQLAGDKGITLSYGPPWAHYLGGFQDRLLGGPLGLPGLCYTAPEGVEHEDNTGVVLG